MYTDSKYGTVSYGTAKYSTVISFLVFQFFDKLKSMTNATICWQKCVTCDALHLSLYNRLSSVN